MQAVELESSLNGETFRQKDRERYYTLNPELPNLQGNRKGVKNSNNVLTSFFDTRYMLKNYLEYFRHRESKEDRMNGQGTKGRSGYEYWIYDYHK